MPSEFQSNEPPHVLGIPVDVTPPRNSEMPPVVWVWIFSGTTHQNKVEGLLDMYSEDFQFGIKLIGTPKGHKIIIIIIIIMV